VEHGGPRNGALREPVYSGVDVLEVLGPCATHHFLCVGSLHAPYGLPSLLAVGKVVIMADRRSLTHQETFGRAFRRGQETLAESGADKTRTDRRESSTCQTSTRDRLGCRRVV